MVFFICVKYCELVWMWSLTWPRIALSAFICRRIRALTCTYYSKQSLLSLLNKLYHLRSWVMKWIILKRIQMVIWSIILCLNIAPNVSKLYSLIQIDRYIRMHAVYRCGHFFQAWDNWKQFCAQVQTIGLQVLKGLVQKSTNVEDSTFSMLFVGELAADFFVIIQNTLKVFPNILSDIFCIYKL